MCMCLTTCGLHRRYVTPERAFFLLGEFFKAEAASPAAAAEHSRAAGSGNSEIRKPIMSLAI